MDIDLTALILTCDERENIARTLSALSFLKNIVLVDSGSTDDTIEIARDVRPDVRVVERAFDSHTQQWNFGLEQVATEWVLSLDADYELSPELQAEIARLEPPEDVVGYSADFIYRIYGHPLRASSYPPRVVLFRVKKARYVDDGHTQLLKPDGKVGMLAGKIYHDDRKSLSHWIRAQDRYAILEAKHLLEMADGKSGKVGRWEGGEGMRDEEGEKKGESGSQEARTLETGKRRAETGTESLITDNKSCDRRDVASLSLQDRLRLKIFFAAPVMFFYLLFWRGLILDGWPGWFYVAQRTIAEMLLSMRLLIESRKLEDGR